MTTFGYARVSTDGQTLDAQAAQLDVAGVQKLFCEKASGASRERAQLRKLLASLNPGDLVIVTRLDRLARSTRDLLNIIDQIGSKGASLRSLAEAWADTGSAHGRLMLTVIAGLAEFERELIRTRTGEGRQRAKAQGRKMGRKPKLTAHQRTEALKRRDVDGETLASIAKSYDVSHTTISRLRA